MFGRIVGEEYVLEYKPVLSDDEFKAMWSETPSSRKLSRLTGIPESTIRSRARRLFADAEVLIDPDRAAQMSQLAASIPHETDNGGKITKARVTLYGQAAFNHDQNAWVKEGLNSVSASYSFPAQKQKLQYPPIQPYYEVEASTYIPLPPSVHNDFRRVFIIGDVQIGYWRKSDGTLIPFHDEAAMDLCLQMLARYRPHEVVILGDALDLPEFSKYRQEPAFRNTTNAAIARLTVFLAKIRSIAGDDCTISFIMGNHELRLTAAIVDRLDPLHNIQRHNAPEKGPFLTIPFLLQFDRYNIKCTDQYPSGEVWLTDKLVCTHAPDKKLAATVICGHLVKATVDSDTRYYHDGPRVYETIVVPGLGNYRGKPDDKFRITRTNIPSNVARTNAQQAVATIDIMPDGSRHSIQVWKIEDGECIFREHGLLRGTAEPWDYQEAA